MKKCLILLCCLCLLCGCSNKTNIESKNTKNLSSDTSHTKEIYNYEIYTLDLLQKVTNDDLVETSDKMIDLSSIIDKYSTYKTKDTNNKWSDLSFYVFNTANDTETAYKYILNNLFTVESLKYDDIRATGKVANTKDTIYKYVYKTRNMIIIRDDINTTNSNIDIKDKLNDADSIHNEIEQTF